MTYENEQRVDIIRVVVHLGLIILEHRVFDSCPAFEVGVGKLLVAAIQLKTHTKDRDYNAPMAGERPSACDGQYPDGMASFELRTSRCRAIAMLSEQKERR